MMGTELKPLEFGDYCYIEQHRFGSKNEIYQYKVIGRGQANYYRPVPVMFDGISCRGSEMHEVVKAIQCGPVEERVETFRVCDVLRAHPAPEPE